MDCRLSMKYTLTENAQKKQGVKILNLKIPPKTMLRTYRNSETIKNKRPKGQIAHLQNNKRHDKISLLSILSQYAVFVNY